MTIPTTEPTELVVGDSWQWDRAFDEYSPADGWSLSYAFRGFGGVKTFTVAATPNSTLYEVREAAAATAGYTPGHYVVSGQVSLGSDRFTVLEGGILLKPDPALSGGTLAEKMLARLGEQLLAMTDPANGRAVRSWQQGGRSEETEELGQVLRMWGFWAEKVRRQRGAPLVRRHEVTFRGYR